MSALTDWAGFAVALAFFLLSHSIPVQPPVKAALVDRFGTRGFTLGYSVLSLLALAWLIRAAGQAPVVSLWDWAGWQNHVTFAAMVPACALAALAVGQPNPLSFGGMSNAHFDPAQPGIVGWTRHPFLAVLLLWSLAHLVANGWLAHVILFGLFAGFSGLGMRLIDRRKQRAYGKAEWQRLAGGPRVLRVSTSGLLRLLAGGVLYLLLIVLHGPVIGVQPAF